METAFRYAIGIAFALPVTPVLSQEAGPSSSGAKASAPIDVMSLVPMQAST